MNHYTSRFATKEEILHKDYQRINEELTKINVDLNLPDHSSINQERFEWYNMQVKPMYYAARLWEYPFAILAGDLKQGMRVADVGCGTSPFTPYLVNKLGRESVWGVDQDVVDAEANQLAFGLTRDYIENVGFNFVKSGIDQIACEDNFFDVVYCISVLEHIGDPRVQMKAIQELVRIIRPGGRLIITMDLGIKLPLTNVLDVLSYSGLIPFGEINLNWPKERYVRYERQHVDVFGLILHKSDTLINNHNETSKIPQWQAYHRYVELVKHHRSSYDEMLFIQEYRKNRIKATLKLLLGKYHF